MRRAVFICSAVGALLAAAPASGESLEAALAAAYRTNPSLKAARAGVAALDENVAEAVSAWRPAVSLTAGTSRRTTDYSVLGQTTLDRELNTRSTVASLSQRLFDFGQASNAIKAAEERVKAGRARLLGNEQNILLTAAQAYMDVLQAEAVLDLSRRNVEVLERQLAAAQAGFQRQLATRTDVAQAEARRADALAALDVARENLDSARAVYEAVVGGPPASLAFPSNLPALPENSNAVVERAVADLPAVVAAQRALDAARAELAAAEAGLLPVVSLEGAVTHSRNSTVASDSLRDTTIGLQVRVPLYAGGSQQARIRGRSYSVAEQSQVLEAVRRDARQGAVAAWSGLLSARARLASFQASVTANEVAYEGTQAEYQRLGTRTLLDVLNAERELYTARVNLIRARRDEAVASFQVLAAMGAMTAANLKLPVAAYDPAPHLDEARGTWFSTRTGTE